MLKEMEAAYLAAIVDSSDDAIIGKDLDGTIISWNRAAARIFGYSAEEMIGQSIRVLLPPDRLDEEERIIGQIKCGLRVDHFETVRRAKDGRDIPISLTISPIRGPHGTIIGASKIARDISERRDAERRLDEAYRRTEELLAVLDAFQSTAPIGIGFMDRSYRYIRVNEALAAINGFPADFHIGRTVQELIPDIWPALEPTYRAIVNEGKSFLNVEMQGVTPASPTDQHTWLVSLYPVRMQNEIIGIGAVVLEITDRKRLEMQLVQSQKMEAIGTLAGGIAHDLNNTLVPILALTKLCLRRAPEGSRERGNLATILQAGERARDLVRQILAFSRKEEPSRDAFDFALVARDALKIAHASIPSTTRIVEVLNAAPPVLGDAVQLHQVILNLVINAAQAIGDTMGVITVELAVDNAPLPDTTGPCMPCIRLSIADTGCGIDAATLPRIFEPFFTTKPVGQGTGLGLSMVHSIVAHHGGRIEVESHVGQGTRFDVLLPTLEPQGTELASATTT